MAKTALAALEAAVSFAIHNGAIDDGVNEAEAQVAAADRDVKEMVQAEKHLKHQMKKAAKALRKRLA